MNENQLDLRPVSFDFLSIGFEILKFRVYLTMSSVLFIRSISVDIRRAVKLKIVKFDGKANDRRKMKTNTVHSIEKSNKEKPHFHKFIAELNYTARQPFIWNVKLIFFFAIVIFFVVL